MECIAIGWCFNLDKVLQQINLNAKKFKMPRLWFRISIRFISPLCLFILLIWNVYTLFIKNGGHYNADYPIWAEITAGWVVTGLVFLSGIIAKIIIRHKVKKGFVGKFLAILRELLLVQIRFIILSLMRLSLFYRVASWLLTCIRRHTIVICSRSTI